MPRFTCFELSSKISQEWQLLDLQMRYASVQPEVVVVADS